MHNLIGPSSNNAACLRKTYSSYQDWEWSNCMRTTTPDRIAVTSVLSSFILCRAGFARCYSLPNCCTYNSQIPIKSTELCLIKALSSEWLELDQHNVLHSSNWVLIGRWHQLILQRKPTHLPAATNDLFGCVYNYFFLAGFHHIRLIEYCNNNVSSDHFLNRALPFLPY
jgi:hypothetical protein